MQHVLSRHAQVYGADFETLTEKSKSFANYLKKNFKLNFVDIQKIKPRNTTDVAMAYIEHFDNGSNFFSEGELAMEEFMEYVLKAENIGHIQARDKYSKIVYFHNLSWDGDFIIKYFLRYGWVWKNAMNPEQVDFKPRKYFETFTDGNTIYYIKVVNRFKVKGVQRTSTIHFKCSWKMLSSSIDVLGKNLGMEKIDNRIINLVNKYFPDNDGDITLFYDLLEYEMVEEIRSIFEEYIKNDVKILIKAMKILKSEIENSPWCEYQNAHYKNTAITVYEKFNFWTMITIGATTDKMKFNYLLSERHKEEHEGNRVLGWQYDLMDKWFYGGWTQFNEDVQNKKVKGKLSKWDINSSYPNQMSKLMPYGDMLYKKPYGEHLTYYRIKIKKASIKYKYRNFPILRNWSKVNEDVGWANTRYTRELRDTEAFYTSFEWETILKIYDIDYKIIETLYCKASNYLEDLVSSFYERKQHYTKEGKKGQAHTWKIGLNAMYGKNCTRKVFDVNVPVPLEMIPALKQMKEMGESLEIPSYFDKKGNPQKIKKFTIESIMEKTMGDYGFVKIREHLDNPDRKFTNKIIGATITSYARVQLWETIIKVGVKHFLYSDTDSVVFNLSKEKVIAKGLKMHPTDLGAWDLERELIQIQILGAKKVRYWWRDKDGKTKDDITYCGISKKLKRNPQDKEKLMTAGELFEEGRSPRKSDSYGVYITTGIYQVGEGTI